MVAAKAATVQKLNMRAARKGADVSLGRIGQAATVLEHAPDLADAVLAGSRPLRLPATGTHNPGARPGRIPRRAAIPAPASSPRTGNDEGRSQPMTEPPALRLIPTDPALHTFELLAQWRRFMAMALGYAPATVKSYTYYLLGLEAHILPRTLPGGHRGRPAGVPPDLRRQGDRPLVGHQGHALVLLLGRRSRGDTGQPGREAEGAQAQGGPGAVPV